MFENNICIVWSFYPAKLGKGLVIFLNSSHTSILIGSQVCSSWSDMTAPHPLRRPLWQLSTPLLKSSRLPSKWYPAFSCSCAWSRPRAKNTFVVFLIDVQIDISETSPRGLSYVWSTANRHYVVAVIYRQTRPSFNMHVHVCNHHPR